MKTAKDGWQGKWIAPPVEDSCNGVHRLRKKLVLHDMNALCKRFGRISGQHGDGSFRQDTTPVVLLVDKVYRRPRFGDTGRKHGLMHPCPIHPLSAEGREERGVNVQNSPGKVPDYLCGNEAKKTRQEDEINPALLQAGEESLAEGAWFGPRLND